MKTTLLLILGIVVFGCTIKSKQEFVSLPSNYYAESYRPQYHFTPDSMWMNDPNGMVYYDGEYHLFYQYYPDSTVWGPMHWGHAISTDMLHWEHQPVALYPDEYGYIFSGSAVVDWKNTSGLGKDGQPPLIAIFTYHEPEGEKAGEIDYQTQGIAYSNDKGRTWTKYDEPVLKNPGIRDFRDPKVSWYPEGQKWIMTLAVKDHISFYSSPDLKSWKHESDFGTDVGGHGGVWECPDLFKMTDQNGTEKWVLLVSINPGGPNGGSVTQYFIGEFDGSQFKNENPSADPIWFDWGKDNYAGVTWSDIPEEDGRRLFIGWMSNWQYANVVPTQKWRSAMTLPRELSLVSTDGTYQVFGKPATEVESILNKEDMFKMQEVEVNNDVTLLFDGQVGGGAWAASLFMDASESEVIKLKLLNALNEEAVVTFDLAENKVHFNRDNAGKKDFSPEFAVPIVGDCSFNNKVELKVQVYWDESSIELFVNDGQFQMTNLVFPNKDWNQIELEAKGKVKIMEATYAPINSVWGN